MPNKIVKNINNKNKKAFTLVEIICVLILLGVIATVTIPNAIINSRNTSLRVHFFKAYSTIENALNLIYVEDPEYYNDIMNYSDSSYQKPKKIIDTLKPYLKTKEVKTGKGSTVGYLANHKNFNGNQTATTDDWFTHGIIVLNDNTAIFPDFAWGGGLFLGIDTNGIKKGPNKFGYDFFMLEIDKNGQLSTSRNQLPGHLNDNASSNVGLLNAKDAIKNKDYFKNLK